MPTEQSVEKAKEVFQQAMKKCRAGSAREHGPHVPCRECVEHEIAAAIEQERRETVGKCIGIVQYEVSCGTLIGDEEADPQMRKIRAKTLERLRSLLPHDEKRGERDGAEAKG